MQTKLIHEIGIRLSLRRYWDGGCTSSYHNTYLHLEDRILPGRQEGDTLETGEHYLGGKPPVEDPRWQMNCEYCGAPAPEDAVRQVFVQRLYDSPSGRPQPGDLYYLRWYDCATKGQCLYGWTNCDGAHLTCVLPNGHAWDINSRASNCTLPQETTHRCWVLSGNPAAGTAHVDKNGPTCNAGAGSIASGNYHGFLHNGQLT